MNAAIHYSLVGRVPLAICAACFLHLIWAVGLVADPGAINATALHALLLIAPDAGIAAVVLAAVAGLAAAGLTQGDSRLRIILAMPQQFILVMSAYGCVEAMYLAQYADGVLRPRWFLIVDQVPVILMTLSHTASLVLLAQMSRHHGEQ